MTASSVRALPLGLLLAIACGTAGCAAEMKVLKAPRFSLSHPDFWKVDAVAQKDGEPTKITIGKFSETVVGNEETGGMASAVYERSQAEVEARVYTWPASPEPGEPAKKVADLLAQGAPELQLDKQGLIRQAGEECGGKFKRKFTVLGKQEETMDLLSRPGHRLILLGGQASDVLLGVVVRVPYEQDGGLYCHNLNNMRIQLQHLLDGLNLTPPGAAAPPAPPAGS